MRPWPGARAALALAAGIAAPPPLADPGELDLGTLVRAALERRADSVEIREVFEEARRELAPASDSPWGRAGWRWPERDTAPERVRLAHVATVLWMEAYRAERAAGANAHHLDALGALKLHLLAAHASGAAAVADVLRVDAEIAERLVERRALRARRARLRACLNTLAGRPTGADLPPLPSSLPAPPPAVPLRVDRPGRALALAGAQEAVADARGRLVVIQSQLLPAERARLAAVRSQFAAGQEALPALLEAEHDAAITEARWQATLAEVYQALATLDLLAERMPAEAAP